MCIRDRYSNASASTLVVDPNDCTAPSTNYCTIQTAINAAAVGDTVQVKNGVYPESLDIYKPLTLQGESRDGVQINAIFPRVGEQEMWGEHYGWAVRNHPLAPGGSTDAIVLRSALGYTGEQPRMQIMQHKDFIDAKVELYLKKGSQVWAKLGEFPIERQLLTQ